MAQSGIYFFIGTEAELIKLFPVMLQLQAQQVPYHIIARSWPTRMGQSWP